MFEGEEDFVKSFCDLHINSPSSDPKKTEYEFRSKECDTVLPVQITVNKQDVSPSNKRANNQDQGDRRRRDIGYRARLEQTGASAYGQT